MIELYAITDHPGPPLPGIAPLRLVASRGLAAVCAPASDDGAELSPDDLWRHEEVVEALMEDRDLLPVRYGTRLGDSEAAARVLDDRHAELVRALDRVRGAVEVSVRVIAVGDQIEETDEAVSGSEYLRAKALRAAARTATGAAIHEPLSGAARLSVRRPATVPAERLRAAYLVDREQVESFVGLVGELQSANPTLRLLCTGPWPPYSFADQ